ncbi:hypothetical protein MW887_009911 [Aspergillus wentii]|nr:hypothetical protein MW887_009911 [Aspergillus wentii]
MARWISAPYIMRVSEMANTGWENKVALNSDEHKAYAWVEEKDLDKYPSYRDQMEMIREAFKFMVEKNGFGFNGKNSELKL